jgi:orotate phosphoribosyltransferase
MFEPDKEKVLKILEETEAILKGHFLLSSGLHSDTYFQCAKIFEDPESAQKICRILASLWEDKKIDLVIGPAYGGIILAYELARFLKARAIFAERVENKFTLRRGFKIHDNENVLVAEDVITTGASVKEVIELVRQSGANIIGIASIIFRGTKRKFDHELRSSLFINPPIYVPDKCPLCKNKVPVIKPGSRIFSGKA